MADHWVGLYFGGKLTVNSTMFDQHTLEVLEFPKIISLISGKCRTPYGKEIVKWLAPLEDVSEIRRRGTEISQMKDIIEFGPAFPLARLENARELLKRAEVENVFLEPQEILTVVELVEVSIEIHEYDEENREKFPAIAEYITEVRAFPELRKEIRRAIDEDGEIRDNASQELKKIRNSLAENKRRILQHLERIQAGQTRQPGMQDDVVTMRNGRYVISVPSNRYQANMGILHDRSQTGMTLYVEPQETVEMNNRINMLKQEERLEIDRILRAITGEIGRRSEALLENTRLIGKLDAAYACAQLSRRIHGNQPLTGEQASLDLKEARHPLLITQSDQIDRVVASSIAIDGSRQVILITGPNTGGKTILLKTVGLAVAMFQSGLHIAAGDQSSIGLFEDVLADIGDEQSIELSLSTFSSHMTNIVRGVRQASENTLLLFDEIGAGTDPKEGAALAEAVILEGIRKGARILATTHYSQLKTLATEHAEIENASLEFNRKTLQPTYKLQVGIPGSSYAVEIAGRLGLDPAVCRHAARLVGSGERSLSGLISSLESELATVRRDGTELSERLERVRELEEYYERENKKLETAVESEKKKSLEDTQTFLDETRREIENLVAEIRKSKAKPEAVKRFHRSLHEKQGRLNKMKNRLEDTPVEPTSFTVGDSVEILSLGQQGEITDLISQERVRVKVGNIFTTVERRNLRKTEGLSSGKPKVTVSGPSLGGGISPEIHLRGMTGEEAVEALDKYLDQAVLSGLKQVYVVHGKGTGALRKVLSTFLRGRPDVESIRLGDWNEGGAGVTIVKLMS